MPALALLRCVSPVGRRRIVRGRCSGSAAAAPLWDFPHVRPPHCSQGPAWSSHTLAPLQISKPSLIYATEAVFIVLSVPGPGFTVLYLSSIVAGDWSGRANNRKCCRLCWTGMMCTQQCRRVLEVTATLKSLHHHQLICRCADLQLLSPPKHGEKSFITSVVRDFFGLFPKAASSLWSFQFCNNQIMHPFHKKI